ncbi:MAG: UDP-N-acetylmuramoyl-L-alanine--D-glutamate ligase, partial [Mesorhizobium sp.]
ARDASGEVVVLLSPAWASFDQFTNFEVRGDAFKEAVAAIDRITLIGGTR